MSKEGDIMYTQHVFDAIMEKIADMPRERRLQVAEELYSKMSKDSSYQYYWQEKSKLRAELGRSWRRVPEMAIGPRH